MFGLLLACVPCNLGFKIVNFFVVVNYCFSYLVLLLVIVLAENPAFSFRLVKLINITNRTDRTNCQLRVQLQTELRDSNSC